MFLAPQYPIPAFKPPINWCTLSVNSPLYGTLPTIPSGTSFDANQLFVVNNNGSVLPGSDNTQDFGSSSFRWANVYTGDMHLNNMNSGGNEIDGSEGHWTMQEGSDDLFLINRNTGKKYKFNLTEVS